MRRWGWLLLGGGAILIPAFSLLGLVVVIIVPVAWLLSPFMGGNVPLPGDLTITNVYLKQEQAAVQKYLHCTEVPIYDKQHKKIVGHKKVCRGVTVPFVQAVMGAESDGWALSVSSANALGLMQVTPGKLKQQIAKGKSPFGPQVNISAGVEFLDYLYLQFGGHLPMVAAAYNAGPGQVQAWETQFHTTSWSVLAQQQAVQHFSPVKGSQYGQTYTYVDRVMQYYGDFASGKCSSSASYRFNSCP